jgi:hypothetical protein
LKPLLKFKGPSVPPPASQADTEAALRLIAADAASTAGLMQRAVTEAVAADLKARIKKEVDKLKAAFVPALQAVCAEFEERLKQVSRERGREREREGAHQEGGGQAQGGVRARAAGGVRRVRGAPQAGEEREREREREGRGASRRRWTSSRRRSCPRCRRCAPSSRSASSR